MLDPSKKFFLSVFASLSGSTISNTMWIYTCTPGRTAMETWDRFVALYLPLTTICTTKFRGSACLLRVFHAGKDFQCPNAMLGAVRSIQVCFEVRDA
jgi:hypothetical protein